MISFRLTCVFLAYQTVLLANTFLPVVDFVRCNTELPLNGLWRVQHHEQSGA